MLEMASAFGVLANGGDRVKPIFIRKIATMKGEVLEENDPYTDLEEGEEKEEGEEPRQPSAPPLKERAISPQHAFLMTHLLEGVVQHGTGQRAKSLGRPVAGKTGTSSDYADAWFIGYTPSLLAAVWVGFDDKTSLGKNETGARAALPIWITFMDRALTNTPIEPFRVPSGVTLVRVNLESGLPVSGDPKDSIWEAFEDGNIPFVAEKTGFKGEGTPSGEQPRRILPEQKADSP
jgi:penicillin-binding protein 1A